MTASLLGVGALITVAIVALVCSTESRSRGSDVHSIDDDPASVTAPATPQSDSPRPTWVAPAAAVRISDDTTLRGEPLRRELGEYRLVRRWMQAALASPRREAALEELFSRRMQRGIETFGQRAYWNDARTLLERGAAQGLRIEEPGFSICKDAAGRRCVSIDAEGSSVLVLAVIREDGRWVVDLPRIAVPETICHSSR